MRFETVELAPEEWEDLDVAIETENFERMERSELWEQTYSMLSSSEVVNEKKMHNAHRFVFGLEDGQLVSFGSLDTGYGPEGNGIEFYQIMVHPDHRREGYGEKTFERRAEVAREMAEERDFENFYASVLKPTTEEYRRINAENETSGYKDIINIAEHEGLDAEDLFEDNPMEDLIEKYGFEAYEEKEWQTEYMASKEQSEESTEQVPLA